PPDRAKARVLRGSSGIRKTWGENRQSSGRPATASCSNWKRGPLSLDRSSQVIGQVAASAGSPPARIRKTAAASSPAPSAAAAKVRGPGTRPPRPSIGGGSGVDPPTVQTLARDDEVL